MLELVTEKNLSELQMRLNFGWTRSQQKKEELKQHAADTLHNFEHVLENHDKLELDAQTERLAKYCQRRQKQITQLAKHEKRIKDEIEDRKHKTESKAGAAKRGYNDALA